MRRWVAGDRKEMAGVMFRVTNGRKSPDDLRLEWCVDGEWIPIPMAVGALMADFFYENEDVLYPPERGYKGGKKYLTYLTHAARYGWDRAESGLRAEKDNAPALWIEVDGEAM